MAKLKYVDRLEWYVPSSDELYWMWANLHNGCEWYLPTLFQFGYIDINLVLQGVGNFATDRYWFDTEENATHAYYIDYINGIYGPYPKGNLCRIRPVRDFISSKIYQLRDRGPKNGWIFYIEDLDNGIYRYHEARATDYISGSTTRFAWSNITNFLVGGLSIHIRAGRENSRRIVAQSGHTQSAANRCRELERWTPRGNFSNVDYWSSSETNSTTSRTIGFVLGNLYTGVSKTLEQRVHVIRTLTTSEVYQIRDYIPDMGWVFLIEDIKISEWYLPSKDELNAMYINLHQHRVGGFANANYWSSSENGANYAWYQYFYNGNQYFSYKYYNLRVRAVRDFKSSIIYQLRERGPANGWIFHIIDNGDGTYTYYEAAESDQGTAAWSNVEDVLIGTTGTTIGSGKSNTEAIIEQPGFEAGAAIMAANEYYVLTYKYYIAAPEDLEINGTNTFQWGGRGAFIDNTRLGIGTGKQNTQNIIDFIDSLYLVSDPSISYYDYDWAGLTSGTVAFTDGTNTYNMDYRNNGIVGTKEAETKDIIESTKEIKLYTNKSQIGTGLQNMRLVICTNGSRLYAALTNNLFHEDASRLCIYINNNKYKVMVHADIIYHTVTWRDRRNDGSVQTRSTYVEHGKIPYPPSVNINTNYQKNGTWPSTAYQPITQDTTITATYTNKVIGDIGVYGTIIFRGTLVTGGNWLEARSNDQLGTSADIWWALRNTVWKTPNIDELQIVYNRRSYLSGINTSYGYWNSGYFSSTLAGGDPNLYQSIYFHDGSRQGYNGSWNLRTRPVRRF